MKPDEEKNEIIGNDEYIGSTDNDVDLVEAEIDTETQEEEVAKENLGKAFYSWAADLVTCLVFVVLFFIFVVRIIGVDGTSMLPTLEHGDMLLLLSNVLYEADDDDIVVVYKESYGSPIVKRIIATEGETIDIDFCTGEVWVDGELLNEPYILEPTYVSGDIQFPLTVPEDCVFVMGDNRNGSLDSRWSEIGIVDERSILGKVLFRIFPFGSIGKVK